ncbi:prephenate dehydrogenase [Bifidobacterium cuniculi]|uniref:Prephenate dehydrogenase n=2 Tax=Bifidobacterium cuniculi TaxID=1688 RepID=A0A087B3K4_9BIFI|nr:prephenate dehydrogenase [Bifidobacterium cuniculi]
MVARDTPMGSNEEGVEVTATMPVIGAEGIECPRHVGIVGLGLIGGSLALRLKAAGCRVSAWNHRPHPYAAARMAGIDCRDTLEELVEAQPDVLVLCNPLKVMPRVMQVISPIINPARTTLTDVGSVKGLVREQIHAAGLQDCYVGAHPMTGNEHSGWEAANARLFDNALWAITYDEHTEYRRIVQLAGMITRGLQNGLIIIDDEIHDCATSLISHMPHVVSTALINQLTVSPERNIAAELSAGCWRDMTRVALTDPDRTCAMVVENAENVSGLLRQMARRLESMADALDADDASAIHAFFTEGQPYRDFKAKMRGRHDETETVFTSLRIDPVHWRESFLRSAQRGEYIVRFTSGHHALAERREMIL